MRHHAKRTNPSRHRLWIVLGSRRALVSGALRGPPFLLAGMPALARFESSFGTGFHIAMAVLVTVTVVPALRGGFKRHRDVPIRFWRLGLDLDFDWPLGQRWTRRP